MLSKTGVWRLTDVEIQLRREKGLCYRCDEKFSLGHRYKRRELNVMVVQGESDLEEEIEEEPVQAKAIPSVEISLNYVVGLTNPKTLRVEAV